MFTLKRSSLSVGKVAKPHDLLVPVSWTHYCDYTPGLSYLHQNN